MAIKIHVSMEFIEPVLGTGNADPEIHRRFIAEKAGEAPKIEEEVEAIGVDDVFERGTTVFPKDDDGVPFAWDYQVKGFMKDAAKMLRKADGMGKETKKVKAYKQEIDGLIFPQPRKIRFILPKGGEIAMCQRPLRAQTMQGERVTLVSSEELPEGTTCEFDVVLLKDSLLDAVVEWFEYGEYRGFGQWRNSGKGRFVCSISDPVTI